VSGAVRSSRAQLRPPDGHELLSLAGRVRLVRLATQSVSMAMGGSAGRGYTPSGGRRPNGVLPQGL